MKKSTISPPRCPLSDTKDCPHLTLDVFPGVDTDTLKEAIQTLGKLYKGQSDDIPAQLSRGLFSTITAVHCVMWRRSHTCDAATQPAAAPALVCVTFKKGGRP